VSTVQHHTKLCSKCSTLLVQFARKKSLLLVECCFCHGNSGFNFTYTLCIICYHASQIIEIFHILKLLLICHSFYWVCLPWLIPVAVRSKAWVCCRSLTGIVGSNTAGGMDVCLLWVLCVVR
jgi:hypothetical protein